MVKCGIIILWCMLLLAANASKQEYVIVGTKEEPFVSPITWPKSADWRR